MGHSAQKEWELLREAVPNAAKIAVLVNPNNPNATSFERDTLAGANALGVQFLVVQAEQRDDF